MKIEVLTLGPESRVDGRGEAHIRVLTDEMVGPEYWPTVERELLAGTLFDRYERKFEKFYPELTQLDEDNPDYDGFQFECWFVVAEKRGL